jgi:putative cell wall-binding protein
MSRALALLAATVALATVLAACGKSTRPTPGPRLGAKGTQPQAAKDLGFPAFATKNTTRVGGGDPVADAAGVAQAVYSSQSKLTRPTVVALVDKSNWQGAIAASVLMSSPLHAPVLLTDGKDIPEATSGALANLQPRGARAAGNAQAIRIGDAGQPQGLKTTDVAGSDPYALAGAIDRFQAAVVGRSSDTVLVAPGDSAGYAMPAAGWAAKSGDPVLFVKHDSIPAPTRAALRSHQQPHIYLLGPTSAISDSVERGLRRLGTVTRIQGADPVRNAIAFARYRDGRFGWGVVDPGHGLVFASASRPADAAAAAPLSASGTYGPLLVVDKAASLPQPLEQYLLDIQPGYQGDPVRGVYNHAWLIGDESALSLDTQSRIDALMEIVPVANSSSG